MVAQHGPFSLHACLRARDYIKRLSQQQWYGLWTRVEGLHHYKVMALGSCVKWPSSKGGYGALLLRALRTPQIT
jgi:hypothetical protein